MPNTELPIDLENQVVLMKKYVNFRHRKKMRDFLGYAGGLTPLLDQEGKPVISPVINK